jgi:hypothetical protein
MHIQHTITSFSSLAAMAGRKKRRKKSDGDHA